MHNAMPNWQNNYQQQIGANQMGKGNYNMQTNDPIQNVDFTQGTNRQIAYSSNNKTSKSCKIPKTMT